MGVDCTKFDRLTLVGQKTFANSSMAMLKTCSTYRQDWKIKKKQEYDGIK